MKQKYDQDWLMKHAGETAMAALVRSADDLKKALASEDPKEFLKILQAMLMAGFMSGVIGTLFMEHEKGIDLSELKDSPGYKEAKRKYGSKSADDMFGA